MSFLYPRTVAVHRPNPITSVGAVGYSGETESNESIIFIGLPASIQHKGGKGGHNQALPADTPTRADWNIFIPSFAAGLGSIAERDIVIDDLGKRYQVIAAYWNSLGYRLYAELLQV